MRMPDRLARKLREDGAAFGTPLRPPDGEEGLDPGAMYPVRTFLFSKGATKEAVVAQVPGHKLLSALLSANSGGYVVGKRIVVPILHLFTDHRDRDATNKVRPFTVQQGEVGWCDINSLRGLLDGAGIVVLDARTGAVLPYGVWATKNASEEAWLEWQRRAMEAEEVHVP